MRHVNLCPKAQGGARVCWAARKHKAAAGEMARAKKAGPAVAPPTAVGSAVGEAGKKAGVAMPLAPRAGASGKGKAHVVPGEGSKQVDIATFFLAFISFETGGTATACPWPLDLISICFAYYYLGTLLGCR